MAKTYTTIGTFTAGQTLTAASMNEIGDTLDNHTVPPMVQVRRNGDLTSYGGADIAWNNTTALYDTDTMWSSGANTRLTLNGTTGIYRVTLALYMTWSGTSTATDVKILGDGTTIIGQHYITGSMTTAAVFSCVALVDTATYSYVTAQAGVIGGTSVAVKADARTYFAAEWVGRKS